MSFVPPPLPHSGYFPLGRFLFQDSSFLTAFFRSGRKSGLNKHRDFLAWLEDFADMVRLTGQLELS
jgi:hypothetical protein